VIEKFPKPEENSFEDDPSTGEALENERERDTRREQEVARKIKTLETQAEVDPLTGLLNRRGFGVIVRERYENLKDDPKRPTVVMADIDFFKRVNDTFGHEAGDKVLQQVAEHLRKNVREDDVVARLGGEEFALILNDVPEGSVAQLTESLRARISELDVEWEGKRIPITMSFGIADGNTAKTIKDALAAADRALYAAKEGGRNRVSYLSELSAEAA